MLINKPNEYSTKVIPLLYGICDELIYNIMQYLEFEDMNGLIFLSKNMLEIINRFKQKKITVIYAIKHPILAHALTLLNKKKKNTPLKELESQFSFLKTLGIRYFLPPPGFNENLDEAIFIPLWKTSMLINSNHNKTLVDKSDVYIYKFLNGKLIPCHEWVFFIVKNSVKK